MKKMQRSLGQIITKLIGIQEPAQNIVSGREKYIHTSNFRRSAVLGPLQDYAEQIAGMIIILLFLEHLKECILING